MARRIYSGILCLLASVLWMTLATVDLADARAGGGRSSGSRGSRSFSSPRQSFSPPATTKPQTTPPYASPSAQPRPGMATPTPQPATGGFWRGMAGGLAGGLIGGMIGNMLFGGSGHAAGGVPGGGGCSSIGLFDILLIVGIIWLGMKFLRRRQENTYAYESTAGPVPVMQPEPEPLAQLEDPVQGELNQIRAYDSTFSEAAFKGLAQDFFFKLQAAWMRQDLGSVRDLLTDEMVSLLQKDLDDMKAKGQQNRLENIAIREIAISEAWQEEGQDFITVGYLANLLDYVVDSKTNQVVSGSNTEPVKFEEYWTFVRPIGGGGPWKLGAIQQAGG